MFDPKSDHALNKMDPDAIVYIDPWGTLVRLTRGLCQPGGISTLEGVVGQ